MSLLRYALSALAAASVAYAQCNADPTFTIQNPGDASKLSSCSTFRGNIAIDSGVGGTIEINGVRELQGDLIVTNNSQLTGISASSLERIGGKMQLDTVQLLSSLNFGRLTRVDSIVWNALPNLQQLSFTSQVKTANTVDIQNTQLNSLDGINLELVDRFYIANNRYLQDMNLQLGNVSTSFTLEGNSADLKVKLPNLLWAFNITFRNCSDIQIPSLKSLNGSMGLYGNGIQGFAAPNLTTVGGSLSFVSNVELTNISLPELTTVNGGFQIANNTKLQKIDGVSKLATVGGALDCNGNFSDIALPAIKDVRGAFNIQSSGDISASCDKFKSLSGQNSAIKGKYTCASRESKPGGVGSTPTSSGGGANPTGAAGHLELSSAVMGFSTVFAAILGLF